MTTYYHQDGAVFLGTLRLSDDDTLALLELYSDEISAALRAGDVDCLIAGNLGNESFTRPPLREEMARETAPGTRDAPAITSSRRAPLSRASRAWPPRPLAATRRRSLQRLDSAAAAIGDAVKAVEAQAVETLYPGQGEPDGRPFRRRPRQAEAEVGHRGTATLPDAGGTPSMLEEDFNRAVQRARLRNPAPTS